MNCKKKNENEKTAVHTGVASLVRAVSPLPPPRYPRPVAPSSRKGAYNGMVGINIAPYLVNIVPIHIYTPGIIKRES